MQSSRRAPKASADPPTVRDILGRLSPGTPLRRAVERITDQGNGALVVLGTGPEIDALCSGGFVIAEAPFTPARLAELSKMDGATILDDDCSKILRANVHLHPDASMPTDETGARHRTAQRVSRQTSKPVLSVSEERGTATLYLSEEKHHLRDPAELGAAVNQSLNTLERFRRRLDESVERLTRYEVVDVMTYRAVVLVLLRAELVLRIGQRIGGEAVELGGEGHLLELQLADLLHGVGHLRDLVLRDYCRPATEARLGEALAALEGVPTEQLTLPERVAADLGFEHLDAHVRPLGFRLLAQVPRLPESVRDAAGLHFEDFQALLLGTVEQLNHVDGVGRARAMELRQFFDRLLESHGVVRDPVKPDDSAKSPSQ